MNKTLRTFFILSLFTLQTIGLSAQSAIQNMVDYAVNNGEVFPEFQVGAQNGEVLPGQSSDLEQGYLIGVDVQMINAVYFSKPEKLTLVIGMNSQSDLRVQLLRSNVFGPQFEATASSVNGGAVPYNKAVTYWGVVEGSQKSFAAVTFFEGEMMGVIESVEYGNQMFGPIEGSPTGAYVLYEKNDLLADLSWGCDTESLGQSLQGGGEQAPPMAGAGMNNCVFAYLECEHDMFLEEGSIQATIDQMVGIYNVVALLYFNDGMTVDISEIFVWDTPDTYPTTSTVEDRKSVV